MATATVQTVLEGMRCPHGAEGASLVSVSDQPVAGHGRCRQASASLLGLSVFFVVAPVCAENWRITPSIALTETWTDNVFLTARDPKSDLVTGITPGIAIDGKGSRVSLRLNYTFTEQLYARNYQNAELLTGQTSASNNHQNALNAVGKLEAIENWMFIDATGTISQQYFSPFGAVSPSTANVNRNQTETSNYAISPYIKGTLLSSTEYLVRYRAAITNTSGSGVQSNQGDLTTSEWTGRLNGTTRWGALGWALDASSLRNNYTVGRDYDDSKYQASLSYRFEPQFRVSAFAGQESNNYVSLQNETHAIYGGTVTWTPEPRTEISASDSKRFFGNGYDVNIRHRMARALVTYTASRNVVFQPSGVGNTGQGINYDAFYAIIAANNPGASPDAIRSQVLKVLQNSGVAADSTVVNGYLTNRPNLQQMQQLSVALLGVRNTVTLNANETKQQPLGVVNGVTNDFSLANQTTQRGFGIIWGHQLTGLSSLSLSLNQMRSISQSVGQLDTKMQGAYLLFTTRLSPKAQATIGARHVISDGGAISSAGLGSSYTESALTGSLTYSF